MRTEQDLRDAFISKSAEAPAAQDVLARLRGRESRPRRQWAAPLLAAAAVVIGVGIALSPFLIHRQSSTSSSAKYADSAGDAAGGSRAANAPAGGMCRPDQVTLTFTWHDAKPGGTPGVALTGSLSATNHSATACNLGVKPMLRAYLPGGARYGVDLPVTTEGYAGPSRLLPGRSASSAADLIGCPDRTDYTLRASWGTGDVPVTFQNNVAFECVRAGDQISFRTDWFAGLS